MTGTTLGHFQILDKLGEGGMGAVYKARDTQLDRIVAIKVLLEDALGNDDRRRRFVQEARSASALNHPNIVTIHQVELDSSPQYIVMEHIDGQTLAERIPGASDRSLYIVPWSLESPTESQWIEVPAAVTKGSIVRFTSGSNLLFYLSEGRDLLTARFDPVSRRVDPKPVKVKMWPGGKPELTASDSFSVNRNGIIFVHRESRDSVWLMKLPD